MKTLLPLPQVCPACGCAILIAISGSGCATKALVNHASSYQWQPQSIQRLFWVNSTNPTPDVAVLFDQIRVGKPAPRTRQAVWFPNRPNEPLLVDSNAMHSLTRSRRDRYSIPLFTEDAAVPANQSTLASGYAVLDANRTTFRLHAEGLSPGPYTLPTTHVKARTGILLIGTPIALAVDAVIVMGAVYSFLDGAGAFPSGSCN